MQKVDRLGRTIYHLILQNDLYECLEVVKIIDNFDILLTKNFNGDSLIDYLYLFNAYKSCEIILKNIGIENFYKQTKLNGINFLTKVLSL
jgi:hypothetical protein